MLEGCWTLTSGLFVSNESQNTSSPVKLWRMCFEGQGTGRQTIQLEDGRQCAGPLAAAFAEEDVLRVTEPESCRGSFNLNQSVRLCRRVSDTEAICEGRAVAGARAGVLFTGRFRR